MTAVKRDSEGGFTLVELLVVTVIASAIVLAIAAAFGVGAKASTESNRRLRESNDIQLLNAYFYTDAASAGYFSKTAEPSGGTWAAPCGLGSMDPVALFAWKDDRNATAIDKRAYYLRPTAASHPALGAADRAATLVRRYCENGALISSIEVAHNIGTIEVQCIPADCSGVPGRVKLVLDMLSGMMPRIELQASPQATNAPTVPNKVPTVTSIRRVGDEFTTASVVKFLVTFSESVSGVNAGASPDFSLAGGAPTGAAIDSAVFGSGAQYTVLVNTGTAAVSGDVALNLNDDDTIRDLTGQALGGPGVGNGRFLYGTAGQTNEKITVDRVAPTAQSVSSPLADGSYGAGTLIPVTVTFNEPVTVTGTPQLALGTGSPATTLANYVSGTGTSILTFHYTVGATNTAADLNYTSTSALTLNGGTIKDRTGNDGTLTLPATTAATSLAGGKAFVIDTSGPVVSSVSSSLANGTYGAGRQIPVTVTFNEAVAVTGTPQLTLATGSPATTAVNYTSGSGTSVLTFTYTVTAGNVSPDLNYASTSALALNGGTIKDLAGNNGTLTLPATSAGTSLAGSKAIVIETTAPAVSSVSSTLANGTYGIGTQVPVTVTFNEPVAVTGTPRLTLSTGSPATTAVNYTSGSGTSVLTFTYTVEAGNVSPDLNYASTSALGLNGGSIKDLPGNDANLTLPATTAGGSLGGSKAIVIDGVAPATPGAPDLDTSTDTGGSTTDNVTRDTTPTFVGTVEPGATVRVFDGQTQVGSGTANGSGAYTITTSALATGARSISVTATDAVGNVSAQSTVLTVTIDTSTPTPTLTATVVADNTVRLTFSSTEAGVTFECQVDSGAWTACSSGQTYGPSTAYNGNHTYRVRATDLAGNVSASASQNRNA